MDNRQHDIIYTLAQVIQPALLNSEYLNRYLNSTPDELDELLIEMVWELWDILDADVLFTQVSDIPAEDAVLWEDAVALAMWEVCLR